jgi:acetylglutamate kinase
MWCCLLVDQPGGGDRVIADRDAACWLGKQGQFIQGMRVTDAETMEVVEALAGEVQQDNVGLINQAGGKAVIDRAMAL